LSGRQPFSHLEEFSMKQTHGRWLALAVVLAGAIGLAASLGQAADFKVEDGYTLLFNGKDLSGWRYGKDVLDGKTETPDKRFYVMEGAIVAAEKDKDGKGGIKDLYTVKDFAKAFNLKLEFRAAEKADSGVYIRGPQLQVRDFIRRKEKLSLTKFKNDGWNELDITVKDGIVTTTANGKAVTDKDVLEVTVKNGKPEAKLNGTTIDVSNIQVSVGAEALCLCNGELLEKMTKLPAKGGIGLQAETGKFEFRNIRIKEEK
jgi:hypothetical protein